MIKRLTGILFLSFFMVAGCQQKPADYENDSATQSEIVQETNVDTSDLESQSLIPIENSDTQNRVATRQQQLRDAQTLDPQHTDQEFTPIGRYRLDVAPFNRFADNNGYVNFIGVSLDRIQQVLGDAPIVVRQSIPGAPVRKEVRVYMPYQEDLTGLYLFIENEVVQDFRMDEFNGIQNSSIMDYFSRR